MSELKACRRCGKTELSYCCGNTEKPRRWCGKCGEEVQVYPGVSTEYFCMKCKGYVWYVTSMPPENPRVRIAELEAERDKLRAALSGLIRAIEGFFGKTSDDFFGVEEEDSGESYFAGEYNAALEALKGGE